MKMLRWLAAGMVPAVLVLSACAKQEPAAAPSAIGGTLPAGLSAEASILDLMTEFIDPNADELWEAVAIVSTRTGVEQHQPRTDEEWQAARRKSLLLVEAANLLATEGRPVARPGQQLQEPGLSDDFTPEQAQAEIDKDPAAFVGFAVSFQAAARQLLAAIDKRDVDAYLDAGGTLDETCEGCHRRFWYPHAPAPPGL